MPVQTQILTRRGTAASWTSTNPTLGAGEIGYETDTGRFKIGTGAAAWASLSYFNRDPLTTKGDLYTFSTTDDRLAVGANGETLVADSSTSTGLRYQGHIEAGKNALINGGMDIWQRGTSSSTNLTYIADRWFQYYSAGTATFSRESTIVPTGSQYSMKIAQATASATITVNQAIETLNAVQFAGQTISVSMMCYASTSTGMQIQVGYSTSTDVGPLGTWTNITASSGGAATVTNAWQKMIGTYAIPSTAKSLYISLYIPTLTATTNAYFGQAMMELGSVPTQFSRTGGTIQGELAACQRYYWRTANSGVTNANLGGNGFTYSTTAGAYWVNNPVAMRIVPSAVDAANLRVYDITGTGSFTATATISTDSTTINGVINFAVTGATANRVVRLDANTTGGYLGFSAEL
jgi:hypothetical protein